MTDAATEELYAHLALLPDKETAGHAAPATRRPAGQRE